MATRFGTDHDGRTVEVEPVSSWSGDRVRLLLDGDVVAEEKTSHNRATLSADGVEVRVRTTWTGSIARAELVPAGGEPLALDPEPGTRAARRERFAREHPGLASARHVAAGVAQAVIAIVGVTFLLRLLPAIDLPDLPLPTIDLPDPPDLPLPSVDLPDLPDLPALPGWVRAVLDTKEIWAPVLIGLLLAAGEWRRRQRQRAQGRAPWAGRHEHREGDPDRV